MTNARAARYTRVAIWLHWIIAILIAINFAAVWVAEDMARPEKMQIMANHKAFGITILILTLVRIVWRVTHRSPPYESTLARWEVRLAKTVNALFYILMVAIPLAGWGMVSTGGKPVSVFGLFAVPALPVGSNKATGGAFHEVHEILATGLLVLAGLHVLAALKHQFLDRDATMGRMIPFLAPRP